jgi:hypothetical protein
MKKKYVLEMQCEAYAIVEVEASSKKEAEELALKKIASRSDLPQNASWYCDHLYIEEENGDV